MSDIIGDLIERTKNQEFQAFARLLTLIERRGVAVLSESELQKPSKCAFRVGITGPPGAGKSTIIGQIIGELRSRGLSVGVVAIDPSSPFTNGAILGDRIRYSEHFNDSGVFIRSLGSRGSLGGLSASAYLMLRAFDLAGFDIVLIETVGVGQTELEIMNVADYVSVVLVPESGDAIQAMKAGLLEIADQFIVNKSDRAGADSLVRELEASIHMGESRKIVEVVKTVAIEKQGIIDLASKYVDLLSELDYRAHRTLPHRLQWEAKALLRAQWEAEAEKDIEKIQNMEDYLRVMGLNK